MMEFAPSGAYVEDWRLLNSVPGLFVGLELIGEEDLTTGARRELQGALILADFPTLSHLRRING